MKRFVLFFCLMAITVGAVAEDRLVVTRVAGMSAPGEGTNDTPVPHTIAGLKFKALQRNAEEVVRQLGDKTVWWDVGPDASYASIEIYLGGKRHVINSWYPLFRTNVKVAVSETQGLVPVSGLAEKRKIENGNSAKYRSIVGLFDKVEIALKD